MKQETPRRGRVSRRATWASAILALCVTGACRTGQTAPADSLFPAAGAVAGWERTGVLRTFPADRLWEYIDGGAGKYIQAGVERTLAADYRYGTADAAADIYVMKGPDGPKKLMETESAEGKAIEFGEAGKLYDTSLVFRRGKYFVRLVLYEKPPDAGAALTALGRAIDARLGQQQ